MEKVSCIMPAYNEGKRISNVLKAAHNHPLISEIIVVDDGSTDDTEEIVRSFSGVKFIKHPKNLGKSRAVHIGIVRSEGDFILLLDTDLIGLTPGNITDLIEPVLSGGADISLSVRRISPFMDRLYRIYGLDFLSGERVMPKKILAGHMDEIPKLPRFGLETFFNKIIVENKCRVKIVFWDNARSPLKSAKIGFAAGLKSDFFMAVDILNTVPLLRLAGLAFRIRRQIVN
jgi:glycosyltransferase involved in cell wall biosynthesis